MKFIPTFFIVLSRFKIRDLQYNLFSLYLIFDIRKTENRKSKGIDTIDHTIGDRCTPTSRIPIFILKINKWKWIYTFDFVTLYKKTNRNDKKSLCKMRQWNVFYTNNITRTVWTHSKGYNLYLYNDYLYYDDSRLPKLRSIKKMFNYIVVQIDL